MGRWLLVIALLLVAPVARVGGTLFEGVRGGTTCLELTLTVADPFVFKAAANSRLLNFWCITSGVVTTAPTINLTECTSVGQTCVANNTAAITCSGPPTTGANSTTAFGGAGGQFIDAGDVIGLDVVIAGSATGPTTACVEFTPQ